MKKSVQVFFLLFLSYGFSQNTLLQSGPMVGYCEMKEALIWLQTKENVSVKIEYFALDNPTKVFSSDTYNSSKEVAFTYHIILDQLVLGKKYNYTIYFNNKSPPLIFLNISPSIGVMSDLFNKFFKFKFFMIKYLVIKPTHCWLFGFRHFIY